MLLLSSLSRRTQQQDVCLCRVLAAAAKRSEQDIEGRLSVYNMLLYAMYAGIQDHDCWKIFLQVKMIALTICQMVLRETDYCQIYA